MRLGFGLAPVHRRASGGDPLSAIIADAIGVWAADGYSTAIRKVIKNQIRSGQTDPNLGRLPRRAFAEVNLQVYGPASNLTITDNNQTAPDGSLEASQITSPGSLDWFHQFQINLPAGTYTLALSIKDLGASSPNVRFNNTPVTTTTTWQRLAMTFVHGGGNTGIAFIRAPVGGSVANFAICDLEVFSGSSDLNTTALSLKPLCCRTQDLMLGNGGGDTNISVANGLVNDTTHAQVMLQDIVDWSAVTVLYVAKKTSDKNFLTAVGTIGTNYTNFQAGPGAYPAGFGGVGFYSAGNLVGNGTIAIQGGAFDKGAPSNMWVPLGGDLIVGAQRGDATAASSWLNGRKVLQKGVLAPIVHKGRLAVMSSLYNLGFTSSGLSWAWVAVWNRVLSDSEITTATKALQTRYTTRKTMLAYIGTSISAGGAIDAVGASLSPKRIGVQFPVPGDSLSSVVPRSASLDTMLSEDFPNTENMLVIELGANDLNVAVPDPTAFTTALAAYIDARRAAGWAKIVATTVLPRTEVGNASDAAFNSARAAVNATIRSWVGGRIQAVADWAADQTMGADGASDNLTYYGDKVHPTAAGNAILASITAAAINTVV